MRAHYHRQLHTSEERLRYVYEVADRPENAINYMDMLNPFYNWAVENDLPNLPVELTALGTRLGRSCVQRAVLRRAASGVKSS